MLSFYNLKKHTKRLVLSLTGLTYPELKILFYIFQNKFIEHQRTWSSVSNATRKRVTGAGGNPKHTADVFFVMILFYFRVYPTQSYLGLVFGGTQSWAFKWVHRLVPVLMDTLREAEAMPMQVPNGTFDSSKFQELLKRCPEADFIIDVTERNIQRPKNNEKQKKVYSGKKKRHTNKHTILTNTTGLEILLVGNTYPGSTHDKKMADIDLPELPQGSTIMQDCGYQGYSPKGARCVLQPTKKPKCGELTLKQKEENRSISKVRVHVEHAIGGVKRSGIISSIFRNRKEGFENMTMNVAAGIQNYRMRRRHPLKFAA